MKEYTVKELVKILNGKLVYGTYDNFVKNVCIDSRQAKEGDVFFSLIGTTSDGHKYIPQVISSGVKVIVISDEKKIPNDLNDDLSIILVDDTLDSLQDLAGDYLDSLNLKKRIAITGSVGKTSTRDMVYYVLSTTYKAVRNKKNFNNETGLPLSILDFDQDAEVCVMEIALSSGGTTSELSKFAKPNYAVYTNIGISHIEKFKDGRLGILNAKLGVTDYFDDNSLMFINNDDDLLSSEDIKKRFNTVTVGYKEGSKFRILDVEDNGALGISYRFEYEKKIYNVSLPVPGAHNAINATLALSVGLTMGVPIEKGIEGLQKLELTGNRLNIKKGNRVTVIDDSYNAAPMSMKSAINTLVNTNKDGNHIAILGDMFELGKESEMGHFEVGEYAAKMKVDRCIFVGNNSSAMLMGWLKENEKKELKQVSASPIAWACLDDLTKVEYYENKSDIIYKFNDGDTILVKASNSMNLEEVVEKILK